MARGVMIILLDNECKNGDKYNRCDKIYEVEAILGISTDTYDCLGLIQNIQTVTDQDIINFMQYIKNLHGISYDQVYPPYSSINIKNRLSHCDILSINKNKLLQQDKLSTLTKNISIYSSEILTSPQQISLEYYRNNIIQEINCVKGNFRQNEIKDNWLKLDNNIILYKIKLRLSVSSGTYIRSIINNNGIIAAHAHLITRIHVYI